MLAVLVVTGCEFTALEKRMAALETRVSQLEGSSLQRSAVPAIRNSGTFEERGRTVTRAGTEVPATLPSVPAGPGQVGLPMSIRLERKTVAPYPRGAERVLLTLVLTNNLAADVQVFVGQVVVKDMFGKVIVRLDVRESRGSSSGRSLRLDSAVVSHYAPLSFKRLRYLDMRQLITEFALKQVVYMDGTREYSAQLR